MNDLKLRTSVSSNGLATVSLSHPDTDEAVRYTNLLAKRLLDAELTDQVRVNTHYFLGQTTGVETAEVIFAWKCGEDELDVSLAKLFPESTVV